MLTDRRRALWVLGVVMLCLLAVLAVLDGRMHDAGGPGIIPYEFAGTADRAAEIKADWGDEGRDAARASLWLDYLYLWSYGLFFALAAVAVRDRLALRGRLGLASLGTRASRLALAAAAFDAVENTGLLLGLGGHGGDTALAVAWFCAAVKFVLLAAAILYVVVGLSLPRRR